MISVEERGEGVTGVLAGFAAEISFEDLPKNIVHQTKRVICDSIGCILGGYTNERGRIIRKHIKKLGGSPDCTIIGDGEKSSIANAAMANSCMGNSLDWDDVLFVSSHPAVPIVCSALALCEAEGATGKDLLTAVAVGYDVASRIGLSARCMFNVVEGKLKRRTPMGFSWQVFGAAIAAAKILKLDRWRMIQTFSLAGIRAPVPCQNKFGNPPERLPWSKYADIGWIAQAGVTGALLAEAGYTGPIGILDGENGFLNMIGADNVDFGFMVDNLGKKWWIEETSFKPWPSCRYNAHALDPFIQIIESNNIPGEEIEKVVVKSGFMLGNPIFKIVDPDGPISMQFSVPHSLANAAFRIKPSPRWQYPESITDPKRKAFRRKVSIEGNDQTMKTIAEDMTSGYPRQPKRLPTTVEVKAKGKLFEKSVEYAKGDPWLPETVMTDEELKEKYRANATEISDLSPSWRQKTEKAIETIFALEGLKDIDELICLLS